MNKGAGYSRTGAFAAIAMLLLAFTGCRHPEPASPSPAAVELTQAQVMTVPVDHQFVGQTSAKETVELRARVGGFLEKIHFLEGSHVHVGEVLFEIERSTYRAALEAAEANLARDQASALKASQDVQRLRPLAASQAAPEQDLDAAIAQQAASQAAMRVDKAQIAQARLDLSYTTVRSPIDGVIGKLAVTRGNLVGKGDNTLLATVNSYNPMYVYFSIPESSVRSFLRQHQGKGSSGQLQLQLSDGHAYPLRGTVNFADRAIDQNTGTLAVRGVFANPEGLLRPGQFVRIVVSGEVSQNAILVPQKSVTDMLNKKMVMIVDAHNVVNLREVTLGGEYQDKVIITHGLQGGERVIAEGMQKVRPGDTVAPLSVATHGGR